MAQEADQEDQQTFEEVDEQMDEEVVQEEGNAEMGLSLGGGDNFWRFSVLDIVSMRYTSHPFEQLTRIKQFKEPTAKLNMTTDYLEGSSKVNESDPIQKFLHAIPPFSVEYVVPLDFIIRGVSYMYFHTTTYDLDALAGPDQPDGKSSVPLCKMKTYYDFFSISIHPVTNPSDGIDFTLGIGAANIGGGYEGGFRGRPETNYKRITEFARFSTVPAFFKRLGIDVNGDTFGFRFSLTVLNKTTVIERNVFLESDTLKKFGLMITPNGQDYANFSGVMLRVAMTFRL